MVTLVKIIKIGFIPLIFIIIYLTLGELKEYDLENKIQKGFYKLTEKEKLANIKFQQLEYYVSKKKKNKYLSKLQLTILKSCINEKLKIVTPEIVIITSALTAILCFLIALSKIEVIVPALLIGVVGYRLPQFILNLLVEKQGLVVDKSLVIFINTMINFCGFKNDIVYAIENSIPFVRGSIKDYCTKFVYEVHYGIPPQEALENFREKIDNNQFKQMIKNLQLCARYSNRYLEVLSGSKDLILKYNKEHSKKRKEAKVGRISMLILVSVCLFIFFILTSMNVTLVNTLKTTIIGKVIITYVVAVCVLAFHIGVKISKFDY